MAAMLMALAAMKFTTSVWRLFFSRSLIHCLCFLSSQPATDFHCTRVWVCGCVDGSGIIDILQQYNTKKKLETVFKGMVTDTYKISSVDPHTYAKRFVKFMDANSVGVGGKR